MIGERKFPLKFIQYENFENATLRRRLKLAISLATVYQFKIKFNSSNFTKTIENETDDFLLKSELYSDRSMLHTTFV